MNMGVAIHWDFALALANIGVTFCSTAHHSSPHFVQYDFSFGFYARIQEHGGADLRTSGVWLLCSVADFVLHLGPEKLRLWR